MSRALTKASLEQLTRTLARRDPMLGRVLRETGLPQLNARRPGFATLIRIILEQQVSLASGEAVFRKLASGVEALRPQVLAHTTEARLRSLGLTGQKARYCRQLAIAIDSGSLDLTGLGDDDEAIDKLTRVHGIGTWTAEVYLLMALRRPDVWPSKDLALMVALQQLKKLRARPSPIEIIAFAEAWRPYRSVAARMLWHYYLA